MIISCLTKPEKKLEEKTPIRTKEKAHDRRFALSHILSFPTQKIQSFDAFFFNEKKTENH